MKIAITAWGNRVSPVFDSARTLLVAEIINRSIQNQTFEAFQPDKIMELTEFLQKEKVPPLICGAISTQPANTIVNENIRLISFVSGNAMDILNAFAKRNTIDQTHMMPGCSLAYSRK